MPSGALDFPDIPQIYARFAALAKLSPEPGGSLLLYTGFDSDGIAVATASNVAGAASLGIEADAMRAKAALRAGVCDFVVNTLDEALRILKNEVRKRRAVSVTVLGQAQAVVADMIERGVQPDVLAFPVKELIERGARLLSESSTEDGLVAVTWKVASEPVRWLPVLDELAAGSLENKGARMRWVEAAPRYLGKAFAGQRYLRMTEVEIAAFLKGIGTARSTGEIPVEVLVSREGEQISVKP